MVLSDLTDCWHAGYRLVMTMAARAIEPQNLTIVITFEP